MENSQILKKIQDIKENDFVNDLLIPLLYKLKYDRVDFYGGVNEKGKDIICWKKNDFDDVELTVIQVKRFKFSAKSSSTNSFSEVVTQLQQASENKIPDIDKNLILPDKILFITPFQVETRALESRFAGYGQLRNRSIKVIDGPKFIDLLKSKCPDLYQELVGEKNVFENIIINQLVNLELSNALKLRTTFDINKIYSDLEFGIGKLSSKIFCSYEFSHVSKYISLNYNEWNAIKCIDEFIFKKLNVHIIKTSVEEVENNNQELISLNEEIEKNIKKLADRNVEIKKTIDNLNRDLPNVYKEITQKFSEKINEVDTYQFENYNFFKNGAKFFIDIESIKDRKDESKEDDIVKNYIKSIHDESLSWLNLKRFSFLVEDIDRLSKEIEENQKKIAEYKQNLVHDVSFNCLFDGCGLVGKLRSKQSWIVYESEKINNSFSISQIKEFVVNCKDVIDSTDKILSNYIVKDLVGIKYDSNIVSIANKTKLTIKIDNIFDTGENVFLLGAAGSGKTTSLQMYTRRKIETKDNQRIYIYIPLARISQFFEKIEINDSDCSKLDKLFISISLYFESFGYLASRDKISEIFSNEYVTCVFDGLDEIITKADWIIDSIKQLSVINVNIQIIVSARISGDFVDKLSFFSINLMPFTDVQRDEFIINWFDENKKKSDKLINHLKENEDLSKIVRSPLSATIFCNLADNDIPLPKSEIRLYEERLKLLLGLYDIHKKSVRLKTDDYTLEKIAKKIAFNFQKKKIRYDSYSKIESYIIYKLKDEIDEYKIKIAFKELIDPCNVLIPMTYDGLIGFGHLRYQEYLCAKELCSNRGISINQYIRDGWWRGALTLFSKMTDDIEPIIASLIYKDNLSNSSDSLLAMIDSRPERERERLMDIVKKHLELDDIDFIIDSIGY